MSALENEPAVDWSGDEESYASPVEGEGIVELFRGPDLYIKNAHTLSPAQRRHIAQWMLNLYVQQGVDQREIARRAGVSHNTAKRYIKMALEAVEQENSSEARALLIEQHRALAAAHWAAAMDTSDYDRSSKAAVIVTKQLERLAKLQGADAPEQVQAVVAQVTPAEVSLLELVAQQERDNAMRAAQDD